jgi:VWFA-related protein
MAILLTFAGVLPAQQGSSQPPPTIRVTTHLVLVDVVVTDKAGKPVSGLKAENFTIEEKGKKQKVSFFSTPEDAQQQGAPPELAPGLYSNKPEYRSPGGPVTAILLDAVNTPFKDQAYSRLQMLKYVREQLKPGQRIGVFTLTNGLGVLQDFTADPKILEAALEKYKPQEQEFQKAVPPPVSGGVAAPNAQIEATQAAAAAFQAVQLSYVSDRRVEMTLEAMRSLGRILSGIPGRKEIIWMTAAFPFDLIPENRDISEAELLADLPNIDVRQKSVDVRAAGSYAASARGRYAQQIKETGAQMADAQIAIYPVDVRGLASGMEFEREDTAGRQGAAISDVAFVRLSDATASQQTMREIAAETGGKAYVNQNEIKDGVALALADNSAAYTIGYYPEDNKWDGKYRTVKVKLDRNGVEMHHRSGYFAIDPSQLKNRNSDQSLAEALRDVVPDTQVTFSAQVKPGDKGKVSVDYLVDPKTISTEDSGGGKKLKFSYYAAVVSADGKVVDTRSAKVDQVFKQDVYDQILQKGILLHLDLNPPADKKDQLRLAVQDDRTGMVGTIDAHMPE